jgi:ureidoacrylate peracid hydrolase
MSKKTDQTRRQILLAGFTAAPFVRAVKAGPTLSRTAKRDMVIKLDARPESISMRASDTAVVVVDMQNDFGSKGGMFDLAGIDITGIQKVVAPTGRVIISARKAGIQIVYLKMAFQPDLSDMGAPDSVNRVRHLEMNVGKVVRAPDGKESRILIRDTWNTDILTELKPSEHDILVYKNRFSGFYETNLHARLTKLGIKHLVFTGCTTSICVESTVRDAMFRDYLPILLSDCMSEPIGEKLVRSNHEASLLSAETLFGWVSSADKFIAALASSSAKEPA